MNADFQDRFRKIILKIEESGNAYAEAKADSWYAQEMCSAIRASIQLKAIQDDPKISVAKAEMIAKASPEYQQHLEETREKIRAENRAKAEYHKWDASFEGNRSLSSLEKRTQSLIGD